MQMLPIICTRPILGALSLLMSMLFAATAAHATIPDSLRTACTVESDIGHEYIFCDDGVPSVTFGGAVPNPNGDLAITVPARYDNNATEGDDHDAEYVGLPPMAPNATDMLGAAPALSAEPGTVALDVDMTFPNAAPPTDGYPLIVFTHGCCSGDKNSWQPPANGPQLEPDGQRWHFNNAWFASRGYAVMNFTLRGFTPNGQGSSGFSGLMSRKLEINDYQHLVCQMYADTQDGNWDSLASTTVQPRINPEKVILLGGSFAGGFTYMALTDPVWQCNTETGADGTTMKVAAAVPMYTWTDLIYALVPTGRHRMENDAPLPHFGGCDSGSRNIAPDGTVTNCSDAADVADPTPNGIPKASITTALFGSGGGGALGANFPPELLQTYSCIGPNSQYPLEIAAACASNMTEDTSLPNFVRDRSPYYQYRFFDEIASNPDFQVPLFSIATTTDMLFPMSEHRRMHRRIRSVLPSYPLKTNFGDYQHFNQNKDKEWDDLCGSNNDICKQADYPNGDFNQAPTNRTRQGVISRMNAFIDHYAQPTANPNQPAPDFDSTAAIQVCPENATIKWAADEPGERFAAESFNNLRDSTASFSTGAGSLTTLANTTLNEVPTNSRAPATDPIAGLAANPAANRPLGCHIATGAAGQGIAAFETDFLTEELIYIGATTFDIEFVITGDTDSIQLNTRIYDVFPDGTLLLIDRAARRVTPTEVAHGVLTTESLGNAYRFVAGNKIRVEVFQDDEAGVGYLKDSDPVSSATINSLAMQMPSRTPANAPILVTGLTTSNATSNINANQSGTAGNFTLTNNSGQDDTLTGFTLNISDATRVASVTVDINGNQTMLNNPQTGDNVITLSTAETIVRDDSVTINLSMTTTPAPTTTTSWGLMNTAVASNDSHYNQYSLAGLLVVLFAAVFFVLRGKYSRWLAGFALGTALWLTGCSGESSPDINNNDAAGPPAAATITLSLTATELEGTEDSRDQSPSNLPRVIEQVAVFD